MVAIKEVFIGSPRIRYVNPRRREALAFVIFKILAKKLLHLIDNPDCLFSKVFKGRYFWNSDPLDPHKSYSPSYGWRSICSARSVVNKRLIKRVETGQTISVWNDPWIPAPRPRSAN